MHTTESSRMRSKTKVRTEKKREKSSGTERWPAPCVERGNFILVPKVLFRDLESLSTKNRAFQPHHLWLLLALQADRFRDRPPRYYWAAIAGWCGKDKNTVRRWGYELRDMGLLGIQECKELDPDQPKQPGRRNERNRFHLEPFEKRVLDVHTKWDATRPKKQRNGTGSGEDEAPAAAEGF